MLNINSRLIFGFSILVLLCSTSNTSKALENDVLKFLKLHESRIINGTVASLNNTRHQVSIRSKSRDLFTFGNGHLCGGSLVSENVVLSAAHCFVNYYTIPSGSYHPESYFNVVMGDLNRFKNSSTTLIYEIVKIIKAVEPLDLKTYKDDIAIIILDGKVPANHSTVRPIILNDGPLENNTLCQASGWGKTEHGFDTDILRTVDLAIIDIDDCRNKTVYEKLVLDSMICAGYLEGLKDTCTGDSGGALVCGERQAGIVSFGASCAAPLSPGVLTNITFYKDWILQAVAKHNGTLPKFAAPAGINNSNLISVDDNQGGGVTCLNCSLMLISLMFIFTFCLNPK